MASLLDRISLPGNNNNASIGPVRNRGARSGGSSPYNRGGRLPKGDVNGTWEHDLYNAPDRSLGARLSNTPNGAPKMNFTGADRALRDALGEKEISIKGASSRGNVVQVGGLAPGTSAADVEAIFKRCGPITSSGMSGSSTPSSPVVRVTFKHEKDAQAAVAKFNGQPADGRMLEVKVVGGVNATLSGRMGVAIQDGSVDGLMGGSDAPGRSKMRSDEILASDSRARILVAPPGTDSSEYSQRQQRGGRGRGRGRGRRGGGGGAARMDVD